MGDFEVEVSAIRSKIEEYFSHLIETLKKRRTKLISELNEILSNYKQQQMKIKDLEKLNKQHREIYFSSSVKEILNDFINKTKTELSSLKEKTSVTVEFEWNKKYAREASEVGKLETKYLNPKPCPNTANDISTLHVSATPLINDPNYFENSLYSDCFMSEEDDTLTPMTSARYKSDAFYNPLAKRNKPNLC